MVYRPSRYIIERNLGPVTAAIFPASLIASAIGTAAIVPLLLLEMREFNGSIPNISEALLFSGFVAIVLGFVVIAGFVVVAFYLALFGAPIAMLLGHRIAHPLALGIALVDAALAAAIAVTGSLFQNSGTAFPIGGFAIALCYALPAGYFYRRNVVAMRQEWSILNE